MKRIKNVFYLASIVVLAVSPCLAQDGLDARTHAKVMRAKRMQAMEQNNNTENKTGLPPVGAATAQGADPCKAGIDIGNVYMDKNNRAAPRENTVVVTGDVIFAPSRNCR
jgi:hypothetical protein